MTALQPIDKPFLEEVIGEPVADFTVGAGCKEGDNVAGSLLAISAKTKSGKKHDFIFKQFPEGMKQVVVMMKSFWRENAIYKTVFPLLEKFASSRGVSYSVPVPKYYKGYNDDANDYILLEDVRPAKYVMPDKYKALTFEETTLAMKEFAKFHAVSYAFLRHEGHRIFKEVDGFLFLIQEEAELEMMDAQFSEMTKMFYTTTASVLEERYPEGATAMRKHMEATGKLSAFADPNAEAKYFPTLCHFDLWCNNMLLKYDENGHPVDVKFIDFQGTQKGHIFTDLTYFLYTSTTPAFRKLHLHTVLSSYYDAFSGMLHEMKIPLPWGFTRGFLIDEFEANIGKGFLRMTFAIPLQLGLIPKTEGKEQDDFAAMQSPENVIKMYKNSRPAMDRLDAVVREMVERNVFKK